MRREKFRRYASLEEVETFIRVIRRGAEHAADPPLPPGVSGDPKDDYLVALAGETGVDALVSGDQDLTALTETGPPILTPAVFLASLGREL